MAKDINYGTDASRGMEAGINKLAEVTLYSDNKPYKKTDGLDANTLVNYVVDELVHCFENKDKIDYLNLIDISQIIMDTVSDGFSVRVLCTISKDNYKDLI